MRRRKPVALDRPLWARPLAPFRRSGWRLVRVNHRGRDRKKFKITPGSSRKARGWHNGYAVDSNGNMYKGADANNASAPNDHSATR